MNKLKHILPKDFKYTIILFLLLYCFVFLVWITIGFLAIGFEEGTNNSMLGFYCYKITGLLVFSREFWQKIVGDSMLIKYLSLFVTTIILWVASKIVKLMISKL